MRKRSGLIKSEEIELEISGELKSVLETQLEFIKNRVGAKNLSLEESKKKFSHSEVGKIKNKNFKISFNKA